MAALLHDAIEDCGVTKPQLIERFGAPVAELVDGLTKLDKLQFNTREENQAESFRKMLLAMARDVRVILVKLADRSHNMRTLEDVPREKWNRIAGETLDIYAPIAHRLGLNTTYRELQELSFRYLRPWRYAVLSKAVSRARSRRRDLIQKVQRDVENAFDSAGIQVRIAGREKTLYSIYRKMDEKHLSFAQVTDIYGFRVIVPTVTECYTALGILHQLYKPCPGKFKDHIAIPKINGYQSLHTTLVGPSGVNVEFQLRTEAMHLVAESGVAAHWLYKAAGPQEEARSAWAPSGCSPCWTSRTRRATPRSSGTTSRSTCSRTPSTCSRPRARSWRCPGAPRGRLRLCDPLRRGRPHGGRAHQRRPGAAAHGTEERRRGGSGHGAGVTPNPAWLGFVRTGRARSKIRHHLKTLAQAESQQLGEKLLAQALRAEGMDKLPPEEEAYQPLWEKLLRFTGNRSRAELLTDLGLGRRIAGIVAKRLMTCWPNWARSPMPC
jgi:GTP pyrophosphokinase